MSATFEGRAPAGGLTGSSEEHPREACRGMANHSAPAGPHQLMYTSKM
jgi:hypothetical protein